MKPIKLVIKGLNSFIEEQTIDFNKLTDRGLFGIFGPTGSGKSTILDGITLALYGDIARKSSNFINTNCNDLNVSFTFQISGSPNHVYVVSRHFKRDKKTGNAKTHSAMVKELIDGEEEILAESVTTVNKTCREILGLSLEDFTRTVVLPQGKFSEFLKLEGKQRRDMLERLFNLQDYGEKLSTKLSKEMNAQKDEANKILGEMNSYEDISEEKLAEEKQNLVGLTKALDEVKQKQDEVDKRYKKGEEIWKMQSELATYKERQLQLEAQAEEIEIKEKKVKQGESAAKVYPFLEGYEKTQKELEIAKEEHLDLVGKQKELSLKKEAAEMAYEKAIKEKEEQVPELKDKSTQLQEAINEADKLSELEILLGRIQAGLKRVISEIDKSSIQEKKLANQIEEISKAIQKAQHEEKDFKVEESIRSQVQEGLRLTQIQALDQKNLDKSLANYNETVELRKALEAESSTLNKALEAKKLEIEQQLEAQRNHLVKAPITREDLLQKQEQLAAAKEKYVRLQKLRVDVKEHEDKLKSLAAQKQEVSVQFEAKTVELKKLQTELEKVKIENLAHLLRAKLQEGMSCPVCGSTTHHINHLQEIDTTGLDELETKVKEVEADYKKAEMLLNELQVKEATEEAQLKGLEEERSPLEELFKEESIYEQEQIVNTLYEALGQYEEQKEALEKAVTMLREQQLKLESEVGQKHIQLKENQKQLEKLVHEIEEQKKHLEANQKTLEALKQQVGTQDFTNMSQEILEKDRKREEIASFISEQIKIKDERTKEREEIKTFLNGRQIKLGSGLAKFDETQKQKQKLLQAIGQRLQVILKLEAGTNKTVIGSTEQVIACVKRHEILEELLKGKRNYRSVVEGLEHSSTEENQKVTVQTIDAWFEAYPIVYDSINEMNNYFNSLQEVIGQVTTMIENNFMASTKQKEEVSGQYEAISKRLLEVTTKCDEYTKRLEHEKENLEKQLREENLTEAEVKLYLLTKEELEALKKNIKVYQDEKAKLIGSIEAIQGKLGDNQLEETEWNSLQEERKQILEEVNEITKRHINLTTLVVQIENALTKLGQLRKKKQKIDYQMAILTDLEKLFKGKRFVEFVAITRLKYISLEASKKLREITNGIYGLEVDDDGKFIIRDYKNGGAQRDASTLSGGETFLASLALALALSAEIQLKGTAPLELFFLDEGFGTLDDDLLEVVISALEKIHHDKLKVGIISHVEAIKNRVPVKLILTPAEAGKGGTKVKLERS